MKNIIGTLWGKCSSVHEMVGKRHVGCSSSLVKINHHQNVVTLKCRVQNYEKKLFLFGYVQLWDRQTEYVNVRSTSIYKYCLALKLERLYYLCFHLLCNVGVSQKHQHTCTYTLNVTPLKCVSRFFIHIFLPFHFRFAPFNWNVQKWEKNMKKNFSGEKQTHLLKTIIFTGKRWSKLSQRQRNTYVHWHTQIHTRFCLNRTCFLFSISKRTCVYIYVASTRQRTPNI